MSPTNCLLHCVCLSDLVLRLSLQLKSSFSEQLNLKQLPLTGGSKILKPTLLNYRGCMFFNLGKTLEAAEILFLIVRRVVDVDTFLGEIAKQGLPSKIGFALYLLLVITKLQIH